MTTKQKSRCRWLNEGDQNYKFFHSFTKFRLCRNNIVGLKQGGIIVDDVAGVRQLAIEHFQNRFWEKFTNNLLLEEVYFNKLSQATSAGLENSFSMQNINYVMWNAAIEKS